jgi:hypothetical protein
MGDCPLPFLITKLPEEKLVGQSRTSRVVFFRGMNHDKSKPKKTLKIKHGNGKFVIYIDALPIKTSIS